MLGALKAVYDMFKAACESYATRKSADAKEIADLSKAREELVTDNKELLDEEVPLQLDHKNGNKEDNSLRNLRLLCPNCHALTPQYRLKDEFKGETYSNRDKESGNRA